MQACGNYTLMHKKGRGQEGNKMTGGGNVTITYVTNLSFHQFIFNFFPLL